MQTLAYMKKLLYFCTENIKEPIRKALFLPANPGE